MTRKSRYTYISAFILMLAVVAIDRVAFNKMQEYTNWVDHTREVITRFQALSHHFKSLQVYSAKYAAIGEKSFYQQYKWESDQVFPDLQRLRILVGDNPAQAQRVDSIEREVRENFDTLYKYNIAELIQMGQGFRLRQLADIHNMINRCMDAENTLLAERKSVLDRYAWWTSSLSIVFTLLAVIFIGSTMWSNFSLRKKGDWLENLLDTIFRASQDGIVYFRAVRDKTGAITGFTTLYANPAVNRLVTNDAATVISRTGKLDSFVDDTALLQQFAKVVETGNTFETQLLYHNEHVRRWLQINLTKLQDGVTATLHDVTAVREYQDELQHNISELEKSNRELEEYAYAASHDLQEPLRKIKLYADKLQSTGGTLSANQQETLQKIESAADRMSKLIIDILKYSSLQERPQPAPVVLEEVLKGILQDLDVLIKQKNAVIHIATLPVIDGVALQLGQLFYNLLQNALKFASTERQPTIQIRSGAVSDAEALRFRIHNPAAYVVISVTDNGIGFDNQYGEKVFGIFKRLYTRQQYEGSGIGLALVKKVVDNHKGHIYADSTPGKGTTFHIILPMKQ